MKTIISSAILALAVVGGASVSQAKAETVWHFPYKGAPYATPSAPVKKAPPVRVTRHGNHVHAQTAGGARSKQK